MIVFKGKDGTVAFMILAPGADKAEAVRKFEEAHPEGQYIENFEFNGKLPASREFRDAWTLKGNAIVVDDVKAAAIHLERVRQARNIELERLDKEQLRYLSDKWKTQEIDEKKQALRDLPVNIHGLDWPELLS